MSFPSHVPGAERLLSELDHLRLSRLTDASRPLQDLLDAADLLPSRQLPADVVSMNSEIEVLGPRPGQQQRLTLCYPGDASPEQGRISVLSPVGLSLLGRAVGDQVSWQAGHGAAGSLRIQALPYQPEASGDFSR
ncbi:GreA/GreB family elongation factor [Roseateles asaccharophilus]|uniref:Regulator of nucleoside diphosphate kinase n=1 Tax=Roseateles asaccharophilus TaxID=582607 RepID=A0ABU2A3R8_9BURK|nr:GreA/GreB family elongation factor [Roseateles asaccharophilus]MDR7331832.1 regulator of nucleoside diphosphate kinase [Roseateles asaccharophilus]